MDQHAGNKIASAIDGCYYDGVSYFKYSPEEDTYHSWSKEDLSLQLAYNYRLQEFGQERALSETRQAIANIQKLGRVRGAGPFCGRPMGITEFEGGRYLNTYDRKPIQPHDGPATTADFPWIHNFLESYFDPYEQKDYFLGWLKVFYQGMLYCDPAPQGHILFLAGETSQGKTFLSHYIVGKMVGGSEEATQFLTGGREFNSGLFKVPLWTMDDTLPATTTDRRLMYTGLLKKMASNQTFVSNEKFEKSCKVEWRGRVLVTCNLDPQSIQIIPNMDASMQKKVSILRVADATEKDRGFALERKEIFKIIDRELPFFTKWINEWEIPPHVKGDNRYIVQNHRQKDLEDASEASSETEQMADILWMFAVDYFKSYPELDLWEGTTGQLYHALTECPMTKNLSNKMSHPQLSGRMNRLASSAHAKETIMTRREGRTTIWIIKRDLVSV